MMKRKKPKRNRAKAPHAKKTHSQTVHRDERRDTSDAAIGEIRAQLLLLPHGKATLHKRYRLLTRLADIYWARHPYLAAVVKGG